MSRESAERRAAGARDLASSHQRDAPVEIEDYDPSWPGRFGAEAARLAEIVAGLELHHIGSTAVPGLAAKPIIDMMAEVDDLDEFVPALVERGGYQCPAAYNATLTGRRWLCRPSAAHRTHHLHLVADPDELTRHLHFRDTLRNDPQLASEYAALKRDLAERMAEDREGYTAAKAAFVKQGQRFSPTPLKKVYENVPSASAVRSRSRTPSSKRSASIIPAASAGSRTPATIAVNVLSVNPSTISGLPASA